MLCAEVTSRRQAEEVCPIVISIVNIQCVTGFGTMYVVIPVPAFTPGCFPEVFCSMLKVQPALSEVVSGRLGVLYYINTYTCDRVLVDALH